MRGETTDAGGWSRSDAVRMGAARALSVPGIVLFGSFLGFGAFARAAGLDAGQSLFVTIAVFALPGQVVLVDQIAGGAGVVATAIAVTLTAVRLLPMTVAILPVMRTSRTSIPKQVLLSHFVAVTVWIESMRRMPDLDRRLRIPFFLGVVLTLWPICMIATVLGYYMAGGVPLPISAALILLTPLYFLLSMMSAARHRIDWLAIAGGLCLGPVFHLYAPGLDLLWTGLAGGTFAYLLGRARRA
ncbi:AzlC family ABC transporter permease [Microbaculum marinum]|uniref:AzlC family ABC transporter permease n=1 Tax=Microbaculum marinum TaxID=1764581 RepID=A0AAW9RT81_9HYPH